jgi:phosphoserine phosphatase
MLAGLSAAALDELAARLPLSPGVMRFTSGLRERGVRLAIASGGFTFAADALAARLSLDQVFANRLEIVDGLVTGRVVGSIITAERKAAIVGELAAHYAVPIADTVAIGDGANDRAMLAAAGFGIGFRAKASLVAVADATIDFGGLDRALSFWAS